MIKSNDILWKRSCIYWFEKKVAKCTQMKNTISLVQQSPESILSWGLQKAQSYNLEYRWLWVAKCMQIKKNGGLSYRMNSFTLKLGPFFCAALEGVGIHFDIYSANTISVDVGTFYQGLLAGTGMRYLLDGAEYSGSFKRGRMHGKEDCCYTYPTGVKYLGDFKTECMEGRGTLVWPDGYTVQTEWGFGHPLEDYKEKMMHPRLKKKIEQGLCTAAGEEGENISQLLWKCSRLDCGYFCTTCENTHHVHPEKHMSWLVWCGAECCSCQQQSCKQSTGKSPNLQPPRKKQH
jgi:hypothetical protein